MKKVKRISTKSRPISRKLKIAPRNIKNVKEANEIKPTLEGEFLASEPGHPRHHSYVANEMKNIDQVIEQMKTDKESPTKQVGVSPSRMIHEKTLEEVRRLSGKTDELSKVKNTVKTNLKDLLKKLHPADVGPVPSPLFPHGCDRDGNGSGIKRSPTSEQEVEIQLAREARQIEEDARILIEMGKAAKDIKEQASVDKEYANTHGVPVGWAKPDEASDTGWPPRPAIETNPPVDSHKETSVTKEIKKDTWANLCGEREILEEEVTLLESKMAEAYANVLRSHRTAHSLKTLLIKKYEELSKFDCPGITADDKVGIVTKMLDDKLWPSNN